MPVEAEPPRVPEPEREDLRRRVRAPDVEAEHLAEQAVGVLGPVLGIAARASVAHPDPQPPVGPEDEVPAVVVRVRLVDPEDLLRAPRQGSPVARPVADDPRRPVRPRGVVHVEGVVARVGRREREPEQALLTPVDDERADVQERARLHLAALDDTDPARLLHDVDAPGLAGRLRREDGAREAAGDRDEAERRGGRGRSRAADRDRATDDRKEERDAAHPSRIASDPRRPSGGAGRLGSGPHADRDRRGWPGRLDRCRGAPRGARPQRDRRRPRAPRGDRLPL